MSTLQDNALHVESLYHRGQNCNFLASAYVFSRHLNPLDYDPAYPRNPKTLAEYIRKFRKDKGLTIAELAREIGIHKFTLHNWEIRGMVPRIRSLRDRLTREVEGAGRFLEKDLANNRNNYPSPPGVKAN